MTDPWQRITLGDLVDDGFAEIRTGPFGTQLRASDYSDHGVPVLNVRNLGFGTLRQAEIERVGDEVQARLSGHLLEEGDVIFGRKGAVDRHVLVAPRQSGWMQGSDCIRLRILPDSPVSPTFLSKALLTERHRTWMEAQCSHGATMASLNQEIIRRISLDVPEKASQRRIASILSAFDELIEINERRIELLEDLARALYREWFVHFRFPEHEDVGLVDSELGPIPEGWEIRGLFEVADIGFGFPFKSSGFAEAGKSPVIRIRDLPHGTTNTFTDEEPDNRYRVIDGDILVGMDGEFYVRQWSGGESWLNQRVARLRPLGGLGSRHLMLAVTGPIRAWNDSIVGTTVAHLGKRHLEEIRLAIPPPDLRRIAGAVLDSLAEFQGSCQQQNRQLAATRDLLLPRLVTGRLDVSEVDLGVLTPASVE